MSKWNLFEIFSHLNVTGEDMPKIRRTAKISRRAVRSRVLASLDEETAETAPAHRRAAAPFLFSALDNRPLFAVY